MEEAVGIGLNLGCGKVRWPGWINVDFANADVNCDIRKLHFADGFADVIAVIHGVEHFYTWELSDLLSEWRRVLKTDGKLILELPCMDKIFNVIAQCVKHELVLPKMYWNALWGDQSYQRESMCHKTGYFEAGLIEQVKKAGFKQVTSTPPRYHFPVRDMRIEATK